MGLDKVCAKVGCPNVDKEEDVKVELDVEVGEVYCFFIAWE